MTFKPIRTLLRGHSPTRKCVTATITACGQPTVVECNFCAVTIMVTVMSGGTTGALVLWH